MRRLACSCFVLGLIGSFATHVHSADNVANHTAGLSHKSFGQTTNHSVVKVSSVGNSDDDVSSVFDLTQDDPDVVHLAGLDIREESKKLAMKMHQLSNEELRVTFIQVHLCNMYIQCVPKKETKMFFCNIFYKTRRF